MGEGDPIVVFRDQGDRREIAELVLGVSIDHRVDRLEMRAQQQIVAVPGLAEHIAGREHASGRSLVLDDHALSQQGAQLIGDVAGRDVGRPTGGETDDQSYRPGRIGILRQRDTRAEHRHAGER